MTWPAKVCVRCISVCARFLRLLRAAKLQVECLRRCQNASNCSKEVEIPHFLQPTPTLLHNQAAYRKPCITPVLSTCLLVLQILVTPLTIDWYSLGEGTGHTCRDSCQQNLWTLPALLHTRSWNNIQRVKDTPTEILDDNTFEFHLHSYTHTVEWYSVGEGHICNDSWQQHLWISSANGPLQLELKQQLATDHYFTAQNFRAANQM